jgi:hypothetical protein
MDEEAAAVAAEQGATRVVVPQHVVHRSFPSETVVLNLQTGRYHGLNPTAGQMLAAMERTGSVEAASAAVARDNELEVESVEADLRQLCTVLVERELIELDEPE